MRAARRGYRSGGDAAGGGGGPEEVGDEGEREQEGEGQRHGEAERQGPGGGHGRFGRGAGEARGARKRGRRVVGGGMGEGFLGRRRWWAAARNRPRFGLYVLAASAPASGFGGARGDWGSGAAGPGFTFT
jgi:hypothetical protein